MMTPEEWAKYYCEKVVRGHPMWVGQEVPRIAELIRAAVAEQRERDAKIAQSEPARGTIAGIRPCSCPQVIAARIRKGKD